MEFKIRKLRVLAIFAKLVLVYLLRLVILYITIFKFYVKEKMRFLSIHPCPQDHFLKYYCLFPFCGILLHSESHIIFTHTHTHTHTHTQTSSLMAFPLAADYSWEIFSLLKANHPVSCQCSSLAKLPPVSLSKRDVQTLIAQYIIIHLPKQKKNPNLKTYVFLLCIHTL